MAQHKYRCETCKKYEDCPVIIRVRELDYSPPVMSYAIIVTGIVGCNSHSDIKGSDEIWAYLDSDEGKRWRMLPPNIRRKLAEFRGLKGEPE